jgi:RNA polymerase sigma-70 factor, ECF subfamily
MAPGARDQERERVLLDVSTILERCRQGDDLAWEALVRHYQGRVYAVACSYMRNAEEARDVAQDIFVRVYERLGSFHGDQAFLPWLLRLSRNVCIDALRRRKSRPRATADLEDASAQIVSEGPTPEERSVRDSESDLLYRAMARMSDSDREILMLREIQGLKVEEIATLLNVPVGTVKSRCNRARLDLAVRVRRLDPSYGA